MCEKQDLLNGRYQIGELIGRRGPVLRFQGFDFGDEKSTPIPIVILQQVHPEATPPVHQEGPIWPSLAWEQRLLARSSHLSLPRILDSFSEGGHDYLIEETLVGQSLRDAWDELPLSWPNRCEWLIQIAEALNLLHQNGAILGRLRPELVLVTPTRQAVIADLSDVLPIPAEPGDLNPPRSEGASVGQFTLATLRSQIAEPVDSLPNCRHTIAPELVFGGAPVDARADLYSFGAMIHSVLLGRELTDLDFSSPGVPRPYLEHDADLHPLLGRLLARTFVFDVNCRFPSKDLVAEDPTGFRELIAALNACSHGLDAVRLDVSAWTSTGVTRANNEDAVKVVHAIGAGEDTIDFAVIVLADGMGGHTGGEVAASLTTRTVREWFERHSPFTQLQERALTAEPASRAAIAIVDALRFAILDALQEANRVVFETGQNNENLDGMGCTAEAVAIYGKQVVIGHIGDSRVYHCRRGEIVQITHDHTLVGHLILLCQLTEEEARTHPQRSELQQAIGGRKDVYPDTYSLTLENGDWLLVCSDGLTNHLRPTDMVPIMQAAGSAEKAARRLVNQTILEGASDNVSVVVVRAC